MKNIYKIVILGIIFMLVSFQNAPQQDHYTLTIKVDDLRNSKGVVQFALYNRDGTIPDENFESYLLLETTKINNESASITFSHLPKGRYAVNILHDENENGKIDKKFLLPIPKEGIGFSNYQSIGLNNRPNFSKASFLLSKNSTKKIKIIYL